MLTLKKPLESLLYIPTRRLLQKVRRAQEAIAMALLRGDYRVTPDGLVVLDSFLLRGDYTSRISFSPWGRAEKDARPSKNTICDQGILKALNILFFTDAKIATWYLTLFGGAAAIDGTTLTAANFSATLSEITSTSEGFSNATRPVFTTVAAAANVINNSAAKAVFHIVATTSITATGGATLSSDVRGGGAGVIWSAGNFDADRELFNGEDFELGYQTSLVD